MKFRALNYLLHRKLKTLILIFIIQHSLINLGCGKVEVSSLKSSYKPKSISISSDKPLEYYSVNLSSTIIPLGNSTAATGVGASPTGALTFNIGGIPTNGTGFTSPLGGGYTGTAASTINAGTGFLATIFVASSFTDGANGACSVLNVFSSISCLLSGFNISGNDLPASGNLTLRAFASNGFSNNYLDSSSLSVKRKVIEKFMNSTTDGAFRDSGDLGEGLVITLSNNKMIFIGGNSNNAKKLFVTDGTTISQLPNTCGSPTCDDAPAYLTLFNDKVYFFAYNSNSVFKLYVTDGTSVEQVSNTGLANTDFYIGINAAQYRPVVANNKLFLPLNNSAFKIKLYAVDSSGVLSQVSDIRGDNNLTDAPSYFASFGGYLYFSARNPGGFTKVFRTDGTSIEQISDTNPGFIKTDNPRMLYATDDGVYFWAQDALNTTRLYKTDGTTVVQVSNLHPGGDLAVQSIFDGMFSHVGNTLIFHGNNSNSMQKIYKYDAADSASPITQLSNTADSNSSWDLSWGFYKMGNEVYFAGAKSGIYKLYKTDGQTVTWLSDTSGGGRTVDDNPIILGSFDNDLYFAAKNPQGYFKLYKTDGTNVSQVMDLNSGNHDFNLASSSCSGVGPVFYTSGDVAFVSAYYDFSTCKEALFRIRAL